MLGDLNNGLTKATHDIEHRSYKQTGAYDNSTQTHTTSVQTLQSLP